MTAYADDELFDLDETAKYLGLRSVKRLYNWRWLGVGPVGFKRANRLVYRRSELDHWLADQERKTRRGDGVRPA
jgi:hypothetical protein